MPRATCLYISMRTFLVVQTLENLTKRTLAKVLEYFVSIVDVVSFLPGVILWVGLLLRFRTEFNLRLI